MPALVIWLCKRSKTLSQIGEILLLYGIGVVVANLIIFPLGLADEVRGIQDTLNSVTILLAMPMILFGCDFRNWPVRKSLTALVIGIVSVLVIDVAGYFIFRTDDPEFSKITSMLVGVYTGGTPNLAALKLALNVKSETYLFVNTIDMLVSFLYLVFLMSCGIRIFRKLFPKPQSADEGNDGTIRENSMTDSRHTYEGIFTKTHFGKTLLALGLSLLVVAVSMGLSLLITGKMDNMLVLILSLTTLSIAASFIPGVKKMEKSYDVGMYLVLVFSLVVSSMVDVTAIDYAGSLDLILYIAFVIFGSLLLSMLLARISKVDSDTMVITSVALINSPLFVPMIADQMKNRKVIITGITAGVIGYAIGNYLGILLHGILP